MKSALRLHPPIGAASPIRLRDICAPTLVLVASVVFLAAPARAVTLTAVNPTLTSNNTEHYFDNSDPRNQFDYDLSTLGPVGPDSFVVRYGSILSLDVKPFGTTDTDVITSSYRVTFNVVALAGEPWVVHVRSRRHGHLTIHNDSGNDARSEIYSVTATAKVGADPTTNLSPLQFGTQTESNEGASDSDRNTTISQGPGITKVCGTGPQTVVLSFEWSEIVVSHGGVAGGDETAVRLGRAGTLPGLSADDYPFNGDGSVASDDGHFVYVSVERARTEILSAGYCSPLSGATCTFAAEGRTTSCLGNNYNVILNYYNSSGALVATGATSVTNGSGEWTSLVTVGGPCNSPPYTVTVTTEDKGNIPNRELRTSSSTVPEIETVSASVSPMQDCSTQGPVQPVPGFVPWPLAAAALLLAGLFGARARFRQEG